MGEEFVYDFASDDDDGGEELAMDLFEDQATSDYELQAMIEEREAIAAMIAEQKFAKAVDSVRRQMGESGVMELVFAIEKTTGWHMEIVASKSDVEDTIFNWYGVYDDKAWMKARNTEAWERLIYDVNFVARRGLGEIAKEVGERSPQYDPKSLLRKTLFNLWKAVDLKLS